MCGIAGSINCFLDHHTISLISHRGPDSQGYSELNIGNGKVFLGHTRLSFLDLSKAGNQPMFTRAGDFAIVFNGEIYNHLELRKRLTGVEFAGHSDTETILYYLSTFGIDAVKEFNGIFAFAFLDINAQKIYLVRDQFGVKPLYYYAAADQLIFGSELKVILANPAYRKAIDTNSLNTFLTFRYNPSPQTLFQNINKLEGGHYLAYGLNGDSKLCNYWSYNPTTNTDISETDALVEYKRLMEQAVKRQLLSDVPVGLLLSGGIDSAVIGFLMARNMDKPVDTFTIGFTGKGDYNELDDARQTASLINANHHDLLIGQDDFLNFFYNSFYYTEEPIAEPTIPALYYVSKLAAKHVKAVMSGQGADEPLAGYKRYVGEKFIKDYGQLLSHLPAKVISAMFPANGSLARGIYALTFKDELDRFVAIYTLFTPDLKEQLFKKDWVESIDKNQRGLFETKYKQSLSLKDSLSRLLYLDTRAMLPDDLLLFNDKLTMANSLECRVPFLDIELVKFIETLPIDLKIRGLRGKYIHRKAAEEWLPAEIINRKKRGFSTPVDDWFKGDFANLLADLINSADSISNLYFNVPFIHSMIKQHQSKKKDYQRQLFILLSLELWYKNFYKASFYSKN